MVHGDRIHLNSVVVGHERFAQLIVGIQELVVLEFRRLLLGLLGRIADEA